MKGYKYIYPASFLVLLILAITAFANPTVNLSAPTSANNTYLSRNSTFINISTNESSADYILLEWNGTNITVDSPQLLLNMHFDENSTASGGVKDTSRYGNNGTAGGGITFTNAGKFGTAWDFDGSTGNITTEMFPNSSTNPITVMVWVRQTTINANYKWIMGNLNTGTNRGWALLTRPTSGEFASFYRGPSDAVEIQHFSGINITTNKWTMLTMTRTGSNGTGTVRLFVDKTEGTSGNASGFSWNTANHIRIGVDANPTVDRFFFKGQMDEARIWNRSLTDVEINATYNAEFGRYNTTQFFANMTDLNDGTYTWAGIINNTAGATNRTAYRTVNIERVCGIPGAGPWTITSAQCDFVGRNLTTSQNLTLAGGANMTLSYTNITFSATNQYIVINNRSSLTVNNGSKIGG